MKVIEGRNVLITGAASGIGRETARAFARRRARLFLCDVDATGLAETEESARALGATVTAARVDVSRRDEVAAFAEEVHRLCPALDILVNNAGVLLAGSFFDTELEDWEWILGVNLWGVIHCCRAFIPKMVARRQGGHVVNVSSLSGLLATETSGAYGTTKYAVFGLSEALRDELVKHDIGVSTICPGLIDTPIINNSRYRGKAAAPWVREQISAFYKKRGYSPARVANSIVDAVERGREVVPVTAEAWATYLVKRISPKTAASLNRFLTSKAHAKMAARSAM